MVLCIVMISVRATVLNGLTALVIDVWGADLLTGLEPGTRLAMSSSMLNQLS